MKHGKRPTRAQYKVIKSHGLVPENWLVVKDAPDIFQIVNRKSGRIRPLKGSEHI